MRTAQIIPGTRYAIRYHGRLVPGVVLGVRSRCAVAVLDLGWTRAGDEQIEVRLQDIERSWDDQEKVWAQEAADRRSRQATRRELKQDEDALVATLEDAFCKLGANRLAKELTSPARGRTVPLGRVISLAALEDLVLQLRRD